MLFAHSINTYGERYVINSQRGGVVLLSRTKPSKAVVAECAMRLCLRTYKKNPETVKRLVKKLDGPGWWASYCMTQKYGLNWDKVQ